MDPIVISALISGAFALVGTIVGIVGSAKITVYRIEQLEKKVDSMSNVMERTYRMEEKIGSIERDISEIKADLKKVQ